MKNLLFPNEYIDSTYEIDFEQLYQFGYRGLIFDVDNTLVPHGAGADKRVIALFAQLKQLGFQVVLLSNNKKERVKPFHQKVKVPFIAKANKPDPRNYQRAMKWMKTNVKNTIFIGDQIFTDILGGNLAGIRTILVKPINPKEEIQIILKRYLERVVLFFYVRSKKEQPSIRKNRIRSNK